MISERTIFLSSHCKNTHGFKNKLKILLGGICSLLFLLIIVLSIPVYAIRILVILLAKVFRPDLGDILNGLSSFHVNDYFYNYHAPRATIIVSLAIHGQNGSIADLKEILLERWIRAKNKRTGKLIFPQFQQYPVRWLGFTFWKNCMDTFSINNHVLLEEGKDTIHVDDEGLNNICEKLLNAPYPPNRSPWEVHLVNNYKNEQLPTPINYSGDQTTVVIIFKVHHCLADGYSMLNALVEGFGQSSLANVDLPVPRLSERSVWESIVYYTTFPFSTFYEVSYVFSQLFRQSPWKVPDSKKEWYHVCAKSDFIPIQKIKLIKSQFKVSFTSVLLSAISSATYKSLNNEKQKFLDNDPEKVFGNYKNDRSMYCKSVLPLPGHSKLLTNHFTYAMFDLPIDTYEDSVDRLHVVDNMLEATKNTSLPAFIPLYLSAMGCHFYSVGKLLGTQRMVATGLTNFPSVPIKIEQNGRKCVAADFMVGTLDGVGGVGIMVLSYGEYIRVAVTAEKAIMSKDEVNKFVKDVINEIDQLYTCSYTQP